MRSVLLLAPLVAPFTRPAPAPRRRDCSRASLGDAMVALDQLVATPSERFGAAAVLLVASFASKIGQSPLQRPKARVKPVNVTKAAWRAGEIGRWELRGLSGSDRGFATAFLNEWAARCVEVGDLRARARCAPIDGGVRVLWASKPVYLSAAEERALEADFERLKPGTAQREGARLAKSTYQYASRASSSAVGGVDVLFAVADDGGGGAAPTLSLVRCGYATDEVVKEGSERTLLRCVLRDLPVALGPLTPVADTTPPAFVVDKYGRRTELSPDALQPDSGFLK